MAETKTTQTLAPRAGITESRSKLGATIIAVGAVLGTIGGMIAGQIDIMSGIQALLVQGGTLVTWFGLRDLPIFRKL